MTGQDGQEETEKAEALRQTTLLKYGVLAVLATVGAVGLASRKLRAVVGR